MLSALVHGDAGEAPDIFGAAFEATACLDSERQRQYVDMILARWPELAPRVLEALMESGKYEYQSEFAKRYYGQGRAEGLELGREEGREEGRAQGLRSALLAVLTSRSVAISAETRARITGEADVDRLEHWIAQAAIVARAEDIFEGEG